MMKLNKEKLQKLISEKAASGEYDNEKLEALREALADLKEYEKYNQIEFFKPLKYQMEAFAAGKDHKYRYLCCANRLGKTHLACVETVFHLLNKYPSWWPGLRFNKPIKAYVAGISRTSVSESLMIKLLGTNSVKLGNDDLIGTGMIPRKEIDFSSIQRDGSFCLSLKVKRYDQYGNHDGWSELSFKSAEAGESSVRGASVDWCLNDEEHPFTSMRWNTELQSRLYSNRGSMISTFTPENGLTELILHARNNKSKDYWWRQVGLYDVVPDLFSKEEIDDRHNTIPKWQQGYKIYGDPSVASGLIYPVDLESIKCSPFPLPDHFKLCVGVDLGFSHKTCIVHSGYCEETGTLYITDCSGLEEALPAVHAATIKAHKDGDWIPVIFPKDALQRQKDTGTAMIDTYRSLGVPADFETFHNGYLSDGKNPDNVEVGILKIYSMMREGKFKIFSTCEPLFEELRQYRMKDGKRIKENDDFCDAMRYSAISNLIGRGKTRLEHWDETNSNSLQYHWNGI